MTSQEAIRMLDRCKQEIISLRLVVEALKPKAEAYDNLATVLRLFPQPGGIQTEDLVWVLEKRIKELIEHEAEEKPRGVGVLDR